MPPQMNEIHDILSLIVLHLETKVDIAGGKVHMNKWGNFTNFSEKEGRGKA